MNFIDESLSVIGDVLKSVSTIKLVISTNAIVFKAVELLCLTFTGGFALISGVTESPLIITLLPFGTICSVILMVDSKIQEYTSYTGETPGGDELSEVEVEKRRTEGLNNSNTAFSLFMLGMTGIHINNAIDTSIMTVLTDKYGNLILSNSGVIK